MSEKKVITASGGFDPVGSHHCSLILDSAKYGDVIVILNSDEWLVRKKGYYFQTFEERKNILLAIKGVVDVVKAKDDDGTVCQSLREIKPDFFANGGDRKVKNCPEIEVCEELGITMLWGIGGDTKTGSSSQTVEEALIRINQVQDSK